MAGKRMRLGKRILAGFLTTVMVASSSCFTAGTVYAEEPDVSVVEEESGSGTSLPADGIQTKEPPAQEAVLEKQDLSAQEDIVSSKQDQTSQEDIPQEQEPLPDEENPVEAVGAEEGTDEPAAEEQYAVGVSDNDLAEVEPELQETMVEVELDGVYQFGDIPSEDDSSLGSNVLSFSESGQSDEMEDYFYREMLARNTKIDVSSYNIPCSASGAAMTKNLIGGVLNEHPDLYFVGKNYSYSNDGTSIKDISLTYSDTYQDDVFKQNVAAAMSGINSQMTDLEKAAVLHDYLTINCEYDYDNYLNNTIPSASYTAYGVLVNHVGVCQGYALAYMYLLGEAGIDCYMVSSDPMNHAWNMVVLDGQNYQVDVTWDDPTWDMTGRSVHTYMFCSDAAFAEHYSWLVKDGGNVVSYKATDTRYDNAFWKDSKSPLVLEGGACYYISSACNIMKASLSNAVNAGTVVLSNIGRWPVWNDESRYWVGSFSGLYKIGGRLYYNDKASICSIAFDGTGKKTEFTVDTSAGYIYGSAYCRGKVLYCLHTSPEINVKEQVLTADIDTGGEPVIPDVPVESVELDRDTLELAEGEEGALTASVKPSYATNSTVTWTSSDETVATVADGTVRAVSAGKCTITASAGGKQAQCSVQVTAKEEDEDKDKALDLQNLSYEYTALDGTKITSAAEGRPKLLIFYSNTCGNCRNTIRGISTRISDFSGIDIYALETNNGTKEAVAQFQSQYGCEEITFSYDQNSVNEQSMFQYARAGGMGYTISWPLICYIDANNRLQYMTMSYVPAEDISSNLQKYCSASVEEVQVYKITYVLDGGTNNGGNPSSYTAKTMGIALLNPSKDGFRFEGWYMDAAFSSQVFIIYGAYQRDLTLYAKWEPIAGEQIFCVVSFDVQGHGEAPADIAGVKAGSTVDRPENPEETGYQFDGWYRDAACTKEWDFDTDIVQSDMTLYAKWLAVSNSSGFAIQEIGDVFYTGKPCKPTVSVYDGDTLLKPGRDYQIKYYNNTNANKDGVLKRAYFNAELPYVEISGRGNYTDRTKDGKPDVVKVNFNILRAAVGDGTSQASDGVTVKIADQLATAKKPQKPFASIKYVKGMKQDVDYTVRLTVENAHDQEGRSLQKGSDLENASVPAGCSGMFLLTVEGIGNYVGSICRKIYVTDKAHLMKNAAIVLGKNQKSVPFTGGTVWLNPSETASEDTFIVKCGKTVLKPGRDYTMDYRNTERVGRAELIITGTGEYVGSKTASFEIKGKPFTAKTVLTDGIENQVYTGRAITQNGVALTYGAENKRLRYGTDYTISYSGNINKGTATMIFQGKADAGYSGSFKKTFKIDAADIEKVNRSETVRNMVFDYCKAGVKPVEEIRLKNAAGITLRNGKDYTLRYVNNTTVAGAFDEKPPTVIVKGKGNYSGEFSLYFSIVRADLQSDSIGIQTTPAAYKENQAPDYAYQPAVKLTDGKSVLCAGKDYEIEYRNNTQADYENYIQKRKNRTVAENGSLLVTDRMVEDGMPAAVITEAAGSPYRLERPLIVQLPIYRNKLDKATLKAEIEEAVYSGGQARPQVKVYYGETLLREDRDYTISYGANVASGKNKGSVVINGIAPDYGGSVTIKFDIIKRPITY